MNRRLSVYISFVLVLSLVIVPVGSANQTDTSQKVCHLSNSGDTRVIQSFGGLCVKSHFSDNVITVNISNPTDKYISVTGILVQVDGEDILDDNFDIRPSENINKNIYITRGMNVLKYNHTTTVSTYGDSTTYNFTEKINATTTTKVPTPYISNIRVADGTIDGKPSSVSIRHHSEPVNAAVSDKIVRSHARNGR